MNNNNDKRNSKQQREEDELKIYGAPGSTLQTPEEHRHDESVDPRKDSTIDVSNDDLHKTDIDKLHEELDGKRGDIPEIDDTLSNEE
jgi:hypothetical protein